MFMNHYLYNITAKQIIGSRSILGGISMKKIFCIILAVYLLAFSSACQRNYYNPDIEVKATQKAADKDIILSENKVNIELGEIYKIDAKLTSNYTDKLVYKSADNKIASVDGKGVVYSKAEGVTNITISTADGKASAQLEVNVNGLKKMNITGLVPMSANAGKSFTVKISFENCTYPTLKIAVDCGGGKITAGNTNINFKSKINQYFVAGNTTLTFKISEKKALNTIRIICFDNGEMIDSKEFIVSKI